MRGGRSGGSGSARDAEPAEGDELELAGALRSDAESRGDVGVGARGAVVEAEAEAEDGGLAIGEGGEVDEKFGAKAIEIEGREVVAAGGAGELARGDGWREGHSMWMVLQWATKTDSTGDIEARQWQF